jgi:hypothetical protein
MPAADRLFDVFVMVDWSSSSVPKLGKDSIWSASLDVVTAATTLTNHRTRLEAERHVRSLLVDAVDRRVLVGFDVPYGYPAGFAPIVGAASGRSVSDWRSMWQYLAAHISDDERNRNNRFEVAARLNALVDQGPGPFWGCPIRQASASLSTHKRRAFPVSGPDGPIAEFRLAERRLHAAGRRPLSPWQTHYNGSVGSQALLAIPVIDRLLHDPALASRSAVWPFTTGLTPDPTGGHRDTIVHAEIWPGVTDLDLTTHDVRDAAQVSGLCSYFADLDRRGDLAARFDPHVPATERDTVVREEGWILGV